MRFVQGALICAARLIPPLNFPARGGQEGDTHTRWDQMPSCTIRKGMINEFNCGEPRDAIAPSVAFNIGKFPRSIDLRMVQNRKAAAWIFASITMDIASIS